MKVTENQTLFLVVAPFMAWLAVILLHGLSYSSSKVDEKSLREFLRTNPRIMAAILDELEEFRDDRMYARAKYGDRRDRYDDYRRDSYREKDYYRDDYRRDERDDYRRDERNDYRRDERDVYRRDERDDYKRDDHRREETDRPVEEKPRVPPPAPREEPEKKKQAPKPYVKPPVNKNGPGEGGAPVKLTGLTAEENEKVEEGWKTYQYNVFASDKISVHRTIPDIREPRCKQPGRLLPESELPATSVVVCFYNEAWSVLLRTVHSVLDRSPERLLGEVLLIDDYSSLDHLHEDLEEHVSHLPKVRLLRTERREGLIRCKNFGAKEAKFPVITYIDSHCEAATGWLPPLLDAVARDERTAAFPSVDPIIDKTFEFTYHKCEHIVIGGFEWSLTFKWHKPFPRLNKDRHVCDNVESPAMPGGIFSISKKFFESLGYYDKELDIWGGENMELSFKLWMCGGRIVVVPCSHIGHVYRTHSPFAMEAMEQFGDYVGKNIVRVARVWLDEQEPFFYKRTGTIPDQSGDVTEALRLRKDLQCKPFQWYLDNIYPEQFPLNLAIAYGEIKNIGSGNVCLEKTEDKVFKFEGAKECRNEGRKQYWSLSEAGEVRHEDSCMFVSSSSSIELTSCDTKDANKGWIYNSKSNKIKHRVLKKCLGLDTANDELKLYSCSGGTHIRWSFQYEVPGKLSMQEV